MDYIKKFDIELDKEYFYAGERLTGRIIVENVENIRVRGVRVFLRGKGHVEWHITRGGERRTVKEDQYFIDDKAVVWGKDRNDEGATPILPRGDHKFPFDFQLPQCALPCSFESKIGTIRYYLRVIIDIPYASHPQGIKYFTIIGPHIDCMDERYLIPLSEDRQRHGCFPCSSAGPVNLNAMLERSAYCCGENIRLKAEVQNGSDQNARVIVRLIQTVTYRISKGVLALTKEKSHTLWEFKGPYICPHTTTRFDDFAQYMQVPVTPPSLVEVCKVSLGMEKSGEDLHVEFEIDVATVPFRIPNKMPPILKFEVAEEHVEGGMYISPEFQLGQVYSGDDNPDDNDNIILYRPVYVCVPQEKGRTLSSVDMQVPTTSAASLNPDIDTITPEDKQKLLKQPPCSVHKLQSARSSTAVSKSRLQLWEGLTAENTTSV